MNKKIIFIGLVVLGVAIAAFFYTRTVRQSLPIPTQQVINSWSGVVPGQTSFDDLYRQLGAPITSTESALGKTLSYPSSNKYWTNDVDVKENRVTFVKERIFSPAETSFKKYIENIGSDWIQLYGPESLSSGIYLFSYPNKGVALYGSQEQDIVYEVWRFPPMTTQVLLSLPQAQGFSLSPQSAGF